MTSGKPHIRAFFAIDIPQTLIPLVTDIISQLQQSQKQNAIRWVKPEHLHITLQFMEALKQEDVDVLIKRTSENLANISAFTIKLTELELFPTLNRPQIISINMAPDDKLIELSGIIGRSIISCGYPIETRPFRGHLTLGKIKDNRLHFELDKITMPDFPEILVKEIVFYESKPTQEGAHYDRFSTIALK